MPHRRQSVIFGERYDGVEGLFADRQNLALESIRVGNLQATGDDRLTDPRHRLDDGGAEPRRVRRYVAPADESLSLGPDKGLDMLLCDRARPLLPWEEAHRDGITAGLGKDQALALRPVAQ